MAERDRRAIHEQLAAAGTHRSRKDVEQLVLALALERDHAEDLAGMELERGVLQPRAHPQAARGDARLADARALGGRDGT